MPVFAPENVNPNEIFSQSVSDHTEVAKVDATGNVTIKNIGTAQITVSVKEGLHDPAQSVS